MNTRPQRRPILRHGLLTVVAALVSSAAAAQTPPPGQRTLIDCNATLPDDVQYQVNIQYDPHSYADGRRSEMKVSLMDPKQPDATEIPEGAHAYVNCILDIIGVPPEERPVREM